MNDIKLLFKNLKQNGQNLVQNSENMHSVYKDGIWHKNLCHANNEKPKNEK